MGKRKSYYLSYPDIKKKKKVNPYEREQSYNGNFRNLEQKEMYDKIYSTLQVFQHRYVNWSRISDLGNVLSAKYDKLGIKDLNSCNSTWVWSEDTIKQFYGTLFINSTCTTMDFMIGPKHCVATKEDLENALGISPGDKNITALHLLPRWRQNNPDACSLYIVPTANTKKVYHLKPEVYLIQKINRMTLLPKAGARDDCSDMLLKISHAIYHGKHFDVAHFLLSEMRIAIQTPDHALPYGHYIFCLLRHKKFISKESYSKECSPLEYSPKVMEQRVALKSIADRIVKLSETIDKFQEKSVKRFEIIKRGLENFEKLREEEVQRHNMVMEKHSEKRFYSKVYKRRCRTGS